MAFILPALFAGSAPSTAASLVFPPYGHSYGIRKATPQHLFMFFGPRTFFDNPQGLATARLTAWEDTTTEKDDDEVVVYGVNSGRHQIIYNTSMWTLGLYGKQGGGKDRFLHPKGIAANGRGDVYVADSGNHRVVKLFNPKSKLRWVRNFNTAGEGGSLRGPSRVGLDEKGRVYVADTGNRRVVVFDSTGNVLRIFPPCSGAPTALAVADGKARWSFFKNEQAVFYAENGGKRLVKCSFDGRILRQADLPAGYAASYGAIDYYHNYWITDTEKHCILKFDRHLQLLDRFGSYGTGDNQFDSPRGITIYKRYGQVFVAERKGAQYYWIGTDCTSASIGARRQAGKYDLTVTTTEYSFVSLFS
ncbi:MAG: NHL repeat-containing protein, partial [Chitinispirillaceae bacterium]|nr:NHL repeat-containing protein [Chitinispirillaceae bacterium]